LITKNISTPTYPPAQNVVKPAWYKMTGTMASDRNPSISSR
ncbi:unnamed protein product, partial [Rotaria socialis]